LKSNGERASPCFKPFLIGKISDKFLPTRTGREMHRVLIGKSESSRPLKEI